MNRACQLVEELGVGEVVGGAVDIYPVKREGVKIPFEPDKYNKLLGTDIPAGDMEQTFLLMLCFPSSRSWSFVMTRRQIC